MKNKATLCFPITETHVLLGLKKEGFGAGYYNGFGGKVKEGETIEKATIRELLEESGLVAEEKNIIHHGVITFYFNKKPRFEVYVYLLQKWTGKPMESEEMKPQWWKLSNLPYNNMWPADKDWIPLVLDEMQIEADVFFDESGKIVEDIVYKKREPKSSV